MRKWEGNVKVMAVNGLDSSGFGQEQVVAFVYTVMNFRSLTNAINFLTT